MKYLVCSILLAAAIHASADELTNEEKWEFAAFYRETIQEGFPEAPEIRAMFFDLDNDGRPEAFATSKATTYETGSDWMGFRRGRGKWSPIKGFEEITGQPLLSSAIFGRAGEFFQVARNDGGMEIVILSENFDKEADEGMGALRKVRVFLDERSVLKQEAIPNLERYIAYAGPRRQGMIRKLEVIEVETFAGRVVIEK